jgi:hypothetical protein
LTAHLEDRLRVDSSEVHSAVAEVDLRFRITSREGSARQKRVSLACSRSNATKQLVPVPADTMVTRVGRGHGEVVCEKVVFSSRRWEKEKGTNISRLALPCRGS